MDEDPASPADNSPYDEASRMVKRERPTSPSSTKSASLPNVSQQRKWGVPPGLLHMYVYMRMWGRFLLRQHS